MQRKSAREKESKSACIRIMGNTRERWPPARRSGGRWLARAAAAERAPAPAAARAHCHRDWDSWRAHPIRSCSPSKSTWRLRLRWGERSSSCSARMRWHAPRARTHTTRGLCVLVVEQEMEPERPPRTRRRRSTSCWRRSPRRRRKTMRRWRRHRRKPKAKGCAPAKAQGGGRRAAASRTSS